MIARYGNEEAVTPEYIGAQVLGELRSTAERHLGTKMVKVVMAVPADFKEHRRNATIRAANLAGMEVLRVLSEPTAAAMAYGLQNKVVFSLQPNH